MTSRLLKLTTALAVVIGAVACSKSQAKPDTFTATANALKELRKAHDKVDGSYQADFTLGFFDAKASLDVPPLMDWSGTLRSAGSAWTVSSELKKKDEQFAHLDIVQSGDTRYHRQTGSVSTEAWQGVQGADLGNYFWRVVPSSTSPGIVEAQSLPEVDPLVYLELEDATDIVKTDLPDGGHRYELGPQTRWTGPESPVDRLEVLNFQPTLTVEVDRDGVPTKVVLDGDSAGHRVTVLTMTLHDLGVDVGVPPTPPSGKVNIGRP